MDFTTANATIKTPDTDTEPPSPSDPKSNFINRSSSLSFTNGALKPFRPTIIPPPQPPPLMAVSYKECLKNHAASLGGHALDGCGEFMPSPSFHPSDPTSLKCAACGCHRNFHRRDNYHTPKHLLTHHHNRQRLLPAPPTHHHHHISSRSPSRSPSSSPGPTLSPQSPPPVSHLPPSFFASPTQMLLALSSGAAYPGPPNEQQQLPPPAVKHDKYVPNEKKRSRTKFSQEQKEKMCLFAEKVGWKMQKSDAGLVEEFCNEVGVRRGVLKVWMHNNKHGQKRSGGGGAAAAARGGGGVDQMIMNNVKYEEVVVGGGGRVDGFMDAMEADDRENAASYGGNAAGNHHHEGGRAASYHLSNHGSSSSS